MEVSLLEHIESYAESSLLSFNRFANFVNELEFLAEQNKDVFATELMQEQYNSIWGKLEVLNASVLDEWEMLGKPQDFSKYWNEEYKKDASVLVSELIAFLKNSLNS